MSIFPSRYQWNPLENICHSFLCFITGEYHENVNIYYLVRAINIWYSIYFAFNNQDILKYSKSVLHLILGVVVILKYKVLNSNRDFYKVVYTMRSISSNNTKYFIFLIQCRTKTIFAYVWKSAVRTLEVHVNFAHIHTCFTFVFCLSRCRFTPGFAHLKINFAIWFP